ncbi:MAG: CaiB/BaiF CoA-transferase family protein [Aestuariivita sp.]|nr:CaiB/BaiF CoA-transferase family protein [Aestuariivita sp.]MCY4201626.1 CaiB/BaiF CoA-transferase family protein [Aestuariivita sp.]
MLTATGPLVGVRVLDLSRVLAGPTCTQLLGDLGASILKIENPATHGDDTRSWGPPFHLNSDGSASDLSAYFMAANRNKRSVALDMAATEGKALLNRLLGFADILIENFKPGSLAKLGFDYATISSQFPQLIYCSISGYGQTGPNREKPGYDLTAQGFGGIMSLTGEPQGAPMKVGVGVADVMCGMYATSGILAALHHRNQTGEGQYIELSLVDTQVAWLINEGVNFLTTGDVPKRRGNAHPNIAPYDTFETKDGYVIIAVGNDEQFRRFCQSLAIPQIAKDSKFRTNPERLRQRDELNAILKQTIINWSSKDLISTLEAAKVPVGPVHRLDEVFASKQVQAREMKISMTETGREVQLIGNPLKFSKTPVNYRLPPPRFGAHTASVREAEDPFAELDTKNSN